MRLNPSNTSNLVKDIPFTPEVAQVWRTRAASNQPQRLLRPVVVPNSCPRSPSELPCSSFNSVGKGPSPTLVVYALTIHKT